MLYLFQLLKLAFFPFHITFRRSKPGHVESILQRHYASVQLELG